MNNGEISYYSGTTAGQNDASKQMKSEKYRSTKRSNESVANSNWRVRTRMAKLVDRQTQTFEVVTYVRLSELFACPLAQFDTVGLRWLSMRLLSSLCHSYGVFSISSFNFDQRKSIEISALITVTCWGQMFYSSNVLYALHSIIVFLVFHTFAGVSIWFLVFVAAIACLFTD